MREVWATVPEQPAGALPGTYIGIADDQYVLADEDQAASFAKGAPAILERHGHELRASKCAWWTPAGGGAAAPAPGSGKEALAECGIPRSADGIKLLGATADGG
eukprot:6747517-Lingulodinium_polyedra.AAC.1